MRTEVQLAQSIVQAIDQLNRIGEVMPGNNMACRDGRLEIDGPDGELYTVNISVEKKHKALGWYVGNVFLRDCTERDWVAAMVRLESRLEALGPDKIREALLTMNHDYVECLSTGEAREEVAEYLAVGCVGVHDRSDEEVVALFVQEILTQIEMNPDNEYSFDKTSDEDLDELFACYS